jgi:hypothetical protein
MDERGVPEADRALEESVWRAAAEDRRARHELRDVGQARRRDAVAALARLDRLHVDLVRRVIADLGWPATPPWRRVSVDDFWLLAQHCPDGEVQRDALRALHAAWAAGTADGVHLAHLEDRVRVRAGDPQRYGTQVLVSGREVHLLPVDDRGRVEQRRRQVGLPPLTAYLDEITAHLGPLVTRDP